MPTAFSRSMRSLAVDGFHRSTLGLLLVAILFAVWLAWFTLAPVALYQVSETASFVDENQLVATFPAAALGRLQPGQPARVRLDSFPWSQYGALAATVAHVRIDAHAGAVQVQLVIHPDPTSPITLQHGLTGIVEVETEQVTPAALVLRAAGQLVIMPRAAPAAQKGA